MNKKNNMKAVLRIIAIIACCGHAVVWICACKGKETVAILPAKEEIIVQNVEDTKAAEPEATEMQVNEGNHSGQDSNVIVVHICGAVVNPGVYEFTKDERICHAVECAGGFTEQADENYLNQAQMLQDGMRIYIPTREETEGMTQLQQSNGVGKININLATMEQLCTLPGIGEGKAQKIIAYREQTGGYTSIEEIMNVEGIKEGLFAKIRDRITVS